MGESTNIEWTDATWNPMRGCSRVSKGCMNCYAETMAARFCGEGMPYEGTIRNRRWNGHIKLVPEKLADPIRWQRPRRVFVNSMSDLFHENVPNEYIAAVFGVMQAAHHHTFQVLTKRPKRALDWFRWYTNYVIDECNGKAEDLPFRLNPFAAFEIGDGSNESYDQWQDRLSRLVEETIVFENGVYAYPWPLPNVWIGASVEDQETANERIWPLLNIPAAVHFLSCEPLLGEVDLRHVKDPSTPQLLGFVYDSLNAGGGSTTSWGIDWVIAGGESGPAARRMDIEWVRKLRDDCVATNTAFLLKQWGAFNAYSVLVGKKKSGRVLDGRIWNEFPEIGDA